MSSIKSLDEKLSSKFKKHLTPDKDISEYAILFDKNIKSLNINIQDSSAESMGIMLDSLEAHYAMDIAKGVNNPTCIEIGGKIYYIDTLSNIIENHNKNIVISGYNECLSEKLALVEWHSYNTPTWEYTNITPLTGTLAGKEGGSPEKIYSEWLTTSVYLLKEYNIWKKAIYYLDNNCSSVGFTDYFKAYYFFLTRQFHINGLDFRSSSFIRDFSKKDILYRELYEDFLYILLNLLLTEKILGNTLLKENLNNQDKFHEILKSIIKDHYVENKDSYKSLESLRWYTVNNFFSKDQILELYNRIQK
jgi:hypothetical protein